MHVHKEYFNSLPERGQVKLLRDARDIHKIRRIRAGPMNQSANDMTHAWIRNVWYPLSDVEKRIVIHFLKELKEERMYEDEEPGNKWTATGMAPRKA
jgi:hypothetical protein